MGPFWLGFLAGGATVFVVATLCSMVLVALILNDG